jgi:hypothetical protein
MRGTKAVAPDVRSKDRRSIVRSLAAALGYFALSLAPPATAATLPAQRDALSARVDAVRAALNAVRADAATPADAGKLAQWYNWPNWNNWYNWPNWNNWSNWPNWGNWFNR